MENKKICYLIILSIVMIIIISVLLGISFKNITPLEYGLEYNPYSISIYEKLLTNGKHYVWPTNYILSFPKTQISFLFVKSSFFLQNIINTHLFNEIVARTKEGVKIIIECSIELLLLLPDSPIPKEKQLKNFYEIYGEEWYFPVSLTIKSVILNEISKYGADNFHKNRRTIADEITNKIKSKLLIFYLRLKGFSLISFFYPSKFQDSIETTEITNQKFLEQKFFQEGKILEKDFKIKNAKLNERIIIEKKTSDSNYDKIINEKKGTGLGKRYDKFYNTLVSISSNNLAINNERDITFITYIACMKNTVSNSINFYFRNLLFNKNSQ